MAEPFPWFLKQSEGQPSGSAHGGPTSPSAQDVKCHRLPPEVPRSRAMSGNARRWGVLGPGLAPSGRGQVGMEPLLVSRWSTCPWCLSPTSHVAQRPLREPCDDGLQALGLSPAAVGLAAGSAVGLLHTQDPG